MFNNKFRPYLLAITVFFAIFVALSVLKIVIFEGRVETVAKILRAHLEYQSLILGTQGQLSLFSNLVSENPEFEIVELTLFRGGLVLDKRGLKSVTSSWLPQFQDEVKVGDVVFHVAYVPNNHFLLVQAALSFLFTLALSIGIYFRQKYLHRRNQIQQSEFRIGLAQKVAHDIRSPVSALKAIINLAKDRLSADERNLLIQSSERIETIATDILLDLKVSSSDDLQDLGKNLELLLREKKLEYSNSKLVFSLKTKTVSVSSSHLRVWARVVSNLINNSIEAGADQVSLNLVNKADGNGFALMIEDNGSGIPGDLLDNLGKIIIDSQKARGSGIGILNATKDLANLGYSIQFKNGPAGGAIVTVSNNS